MNEVKELKRRLFRKTGLISLLPISAGMIIGNYFFSLGTILGVLVSFINFSLLGRKLEISLQIQKGVSPLFFFNYLLRYAGIAGVLILAAKFNRSLFLGSALGLLILQFAVYLEKWELSKSLK